MGLGAISYMLNCDRKPSLLVITDIDEVRLKELVNYLQKNMPKNEVLKSILSILRKSMTQ